MMYQLNHYKPLELLSNSFKIYINNFIIFTIISLLTSIPAIIYQYKYSYIVLNWINNPTNSSLMAYSAYTMTLIFISVIATTISTGLIVPIVSKKYIGEKAKLKWYFNDILPRIVPLIILSIITVLLSALGFLFLIFPGIVVSIALSISNEVFMIEKKSIVDSLKRSLQLTAGRKLYILGILVLFGVIIIMVSLGFSELINMFFKDYTGNEKSYFALVSLFDGILSAVLRPFITCGMIMIYFNLRIEKENLKTEDLVNDNTDNTVDN